MGGKPEGMQLATFAALANRVRRRLTAALGAAPASMTVPRIPEALAEVLADHGWLGQADWDDARRATATAVAARLRSDR